MSSGGAERRGDGDARRGGDAAPLELTPGGAYARALGARLRTLREQQRLSLLAVQTLSRGEFKAAALGAYERGERTISVPRLQRLATLYDVPVDQLLPTEGGPRRGLGGGPTRPGAGPVAARAADERPARSGVRVDLGRLRSAPGPEAAALRRFLASVQVERQDFNGQVLTIRQEDLRVIGAVLGLGFDETLRRLDDLGVLQK